MIAILVSSSGNIVIEDTEELFEDKKTKIFIEYKSRFYSLLKKVNDVLIYRERKKNMFRDGWVKK